MKFDKLSLSERSTSYGFTLEDLLDDFIEQAKTVFSDNELGHINQFIRHIGDRVILYGHWM